MVFIFSNMTIDLSATSGFIYFLGTRNALVLTRPVRMCLYSRYSNKAILNGANIYTTNAYFNLAAFQNYTNWHSYIWTYDNLDLQTEDIEGYYWCEIDVNIAGSTWTNINKVRNVQVTAYGIHIRPLKYHHAIACQSFNLRLQDWFCCGCAVYQIPKKNLKTCLIRFAAE